MRKLLLCLAVVGTSLAVSEAPKQADAQILYICSSYCCRPNAVLSTQCWAGSVKMTCGEYRQEYSCP